MNYEIIGKMFISITKILLSIFGFWGFTFICHYLIEEQKAKLINFIGFLIGLIWALHTIWGLNI